MKQIVSIMACCTLFLLFAFPTRAQSFASTYTFDLYPQSNGDVKVDLNISLENLRPDVYINEFILSIPNNFFSDQLIATIDADGTDYKVESKKEGKRIIFSFKEPEFEKLVFNHNIHLTYSHDKLYSRGTFVDELILPLIKSSNNSRVNVILHMPKSSTKSPSIIKPPASVVHGDIIEWKDVKSDVLFVQFGTYNVFDTTLMYELINPELRSVQKAITLPPDTLFQKIFLTSIQPKPDYVNIDEDGNYLASYKLNPRENKKIIFKGKVQVFSKPRDEVVDYERVRVKQQQKYLLSDQKVWSLGSFYNNERIKTLKTPESIYDYVTSELTYDTSRLTQKIVRRGAEEALIEPYNSICTDFTDTFIAIAREKGILAREIEGYGYSDKTDIRPLSLKIDVLHAWPEFYDIKRDIWVPVDPTWAQTSGIDYFHGFDTSHIALAVHGKNPSVPVPAGFDKISNHKSINIKPSKLLPRDKSTISIINTIPDRLISQKMYHTHVAVTNTGNIFLYNLVLNIVASGLSFNSNTLRIDSLAPFETKRINVSFKPQTTGTAQKYVSILYAGSEVSGKTVNIEPASSSYLHMLVGIIVACIILIGSLFIVKIVRHD